MFTVIAFAFSPEPELEPESDDEPPEPPHAVRAVTHIIAASKKATNFFM